jgi:DNA-binding response OmpR family regulator
VKTILVVEDEPSIAQIAVDYLRHGGFGVITASNGVDALAQARAQRPDLIVLDLGLPRLDGLEVARALRREGDVPIIMLTARIDEADRLAGLELGADDYVTKPFSPRELVARCSISAASGGRRGWRWWGCPSAWRSGDRSRAHAGLARRHPDRSHADRVSACRGARRENPDAS